jgi:hypothetical protein
VPQPSIATSYAVSGSHFILRWTTQYAVSFTIDGSPMPLTGEANFALQTHTFALVATGPVHNEAIRNVDLAVANPCTVDVDGQRLAAASAACLASPTPRPTATVVPPSPTSPPTIAPSATATPAPPTAIPTEPATPQP